MRRIKESAIETGHKKLLLINQLSEGKLYKLLTNRVYPFQKEKKMSKSLLYLSNIRSNISKIILKYASSVVSFKSYGNISSFSINSREKTPVYKSGIYKLQCS